MANTSIFRNIASTGNADICTISCWFKRGTLGVEQALFGGWRSSTTRFQVRFQGSDNIDVEWGYSSSWYSLVTNRKFRDPSAWMHLVLAIDSTQGTPANRAKLYINGVQETSFSTENYMPQNNDTLMTTSGDEMIVGGANASSSSGAGNHNNWFKGEQSHFQFVDGLQLAPTEFGETDATDGMWKIKTTAYATPGTNGFFLKMEDSTNMDLDSSSNALAFTTEGTLTATKDNPSNNFATLSPLIPFPSGLTMTNGNTSLASTATQWAGRYSTQRVFSGKYYVEAQFVSTGDNFKFGVQGFDIAETANWSTLNTSYAGKSAVGYEYQCNNGSGYKVNNNSSPTWTNANFTPATSTIMMAFDLDNGKIWWGRNGTWFNTSGTANPATGTDAAFTGISTDNSPYLFGLSLEGNGSSSHINFGNGYFGTTAIGSPVTSNEGTWAYAPPSGFGAVNTKWINTF